MFEGYAVACIDGKYGFVDENFEKYAFEYEDATGFYNGVAAVKKNGKWALINKSFQAITSFEYDDVVRDEANVCARRGIIFMQKGEEFYMLDMQGKKIVSETFEGAHLFYSEYAAVKKDGKWGFIDSQGKKVIDFKYDDAFSCAKGIAAVAIDGNWGCVDMNGNTVIPFEYNGAQITDSSGIVALKIGENYRFVQFIKYK